LVTVAYNGSKQPARSVQLSKEPAKKRTTVRISQLASLEYLVFDCDNDRTDFLAKKEFLSLVFITNKNCLVIA